MKKLSIASVIAVLCALVLVTAALALFNNGNFENGDFTGWTIDTSKLNGGILVGPPPSYVPVDVASVAGAVASNNTFIVNTAWMDGNFGPGVTCDPYSNGEICLPFAGSDSAVVNYLGAMFVTGNNLNTLTQSGLVAGGDVAADGKYHIFFTYAPVLDKGSHPDSDQPFMYVKLVRIRAGSPDLVLFDKFSYPDDGNPNWKISPVSSSVKYMPWQIYDLTYSPADLNAGDTLTIQVSAAGCVYTQGAHWGYVYVDEFGPVAPAGNTAPSISDLTPNTGPSTGGTLITITGTNFTSATAVSIGGTTLLAGSFTIINDTTITLITPAHVAGLVDVAVINTSGSAFYPNSFTFTDLPPAPTITGVTPNQGPIAGGTSVTITGTNLTGGSFTFGGSGATCVVAPDGLSAVCTTPAHSAGLVDVGVTTTGGAATSVGAFTYVPAPTITGVTPNQGPVAGGTSVTITGTNLTGGSFTFGGSGATCVVAPDGLSAVCTSPAHSAGLVDVGVTTTGGAATSVGAFTYIPAPTITGVTPNQGPVAGGTSVTITGTNLTGGSFTFGGSGATCVVAPDGLSAVCTTPAHSAGLVDVGVTTTGGAATSVGAFTYIPAPTITGVTPNQGPVAGGTSVTITGTNLTGGSFTFGGSGATCVVAPNGLSAVCTTPAHSAGLVDVGVTTTGGAATSVGAFTYIPAPTITGIVPNQGPTSGGTTVVITGTNLTGGTVTFDGITAICTVDSATQITCTSPLHPAGGAVNVVVTTPGGSATSTGGFTYIPATLVITGSGASTTVPSNQYVYSFTYSTTTAVTGAKVDITLPGHTTFVSATKTCPVAAGIATCDLGNLAASGSGSFTMTVLVDKLKKVNTPLTLATSAYPISATGGTTANGTVNVVANTLTPFTDVPFGHIFLDHVQAIWAYGITNGCQGIPTAPMAYCPDLNISRGEMAAYIERGVHTGAFNPGTPALTFTDTANNRFKYYIEALKADGITSGCGGTLYCPERSITRSEMSIFLLRGKFGKSHVPPAWTGTVWTDVFANTFAASWAEELGTSHISNGCGVGIFCPNNYVSRSMMAALVQRTFSLPLPTP